LLSPFGVKSLVLGLLIKATPNPELPESLLVYAITVEGPQGNSNLRNDHTPRNLRSWDKL
jgi:hypothetical protein